MWASHYDVASTTSLRFSTEWTTWRGRGGGTLRDLAVSWSVPRVSGVSKKFRIFAQGMRFASNWYQLLSDNFVMPIFIWNPFKSWTPCLQRCPLQITTMQTKQQTCTGCTLEIKQTTSNNGSWSATSLWKQLWRNWKFRISISTNGAFAMVVKCCEYP